MLENMFWFLAGVGFGEPSCEEMHGIGAFLLLNPGSTSRLWDSSMPFVRDTYTSRYCQLRKTLARAERVTLMHGSRIQKCSQMLNEEHVLVDASGSGCESFI